MIPPFQQLIAYLPTEARSECALEKGEFLFRQQQAAGAIFAVISGRIRLFRDLPDGSSVTLHVARSGETFAEAALFAQNYHCHAQAELPAKVLRLNSAALLDAIIANKDLGLSLSQILAAQVRDMRAMLCLRDIRSADARLLAWLRMKVRGELMEVEIDRPWTGISEELGLTKEAIYRSLSQLQRVGSIERMRGQGSERSEVIRLLRRS